MLYQIIATYDYHIGTGTTQLLTYDTLIEYVEKITGYSQKDGYLYFVENRHYSLVDHKTIWHAQVIIKRLVDPV